MHRPLPVTRMFHPGVSRKGIQNNTENTTIPLYKSVDRTAHCSAAHSTAKKKKGISLEKGPRERVGDIGLSAWKKNTWVRREKAPPGLSQGEEQPHKWSSCQLLEHNMETPVLFVHSQLCCKTPSVK